MSNFRFSLLLPIMIALALAACSSADEPGADSLTGDYEFRSIDEIADAELEVMNFGNDGTATLPIHASVPVACSVVYGTTPEFGSLSTDLDMEGGTHSDHNPLLTGLEPETEYFFRAQGVADNGVVYLSDVMTFTTPPAGTSVTENLASPAMGAEIVGYSSAFGDAGISDRWGAAAAFDDNPNSEWSSAGDGNEAWVEVKLDGRARIDSVEFQSRAMSDGSAITLAFTITTEDGEVLGPFTLPDANSRYDFDVAIEAETLRFDLMDTTGGNTGIVDVAVYGAFLDGAG
jgi:hypothetical protein